MRDTKRVFHNVADFAEISTVEYQGTTYQIPIITEEAGTARRDKNNNQRKNDKEKTLYQYDIVFWMALADLGRTPRRNRRITVDGMPYDITDVYEEHGELEITCRRLSE